jgi:hypothetical protein
MKRLFWLGVGLAAGALVVRVLTKKARSLTPGGIAAGMADAAGNVLDSVRGFVEDVREGMAEREAQIQAAFADGVTFDDQQDHDYQQDHQYGDHEDIYREGERH